MKRIPVWLIVWLVMASAWATATLTQAGEHGGQPPARKGILLVAFGTTKAPARVSFENIDKAVKDACPGIPVRWAYTSSVIRKKLARQGEHLDSPEVALARMLDDGFTHVAVQSLHTIPGAEFHDLLRSAHSFQRPGGFRRVQVGSALLALQADIEMAVDAILATVPPKRQPDDAVVLMGHGSHHPANVYYAALMFQLQQRDPNLLVGCVEGYPEIEQIKQMLIRKKIRKAYLMPFMSVAGDHAVNDMAGDAPDSWKSVLTEAGIRCEPILKGTAEYSPFVAIWDEHVKAAMERLESSTGMHP